jgi:hypothetical protein
MRRPFPREYHNRRVLNLSERVEIIPLDSLNSVAKNVFYPRTNGMNRFCFL